MTRYKVRKKLLQTYILCSQNTENLNEQGAIKVRSYIQLFPVMAMFELKVSKYWCILYYLCIVKTILLK